MFKNKAMYVRVIDTNGIQSVGEITEDISDRSVETIINDIVSVQGQQIVKGVIIVMAAYFGFSTLRGVILKRTPMAR